LQFNFNKNQTEIFFKSIDYNNLYMYNIFVPTDFPIIEKLKNQSQAFSQKIEIDDNVVLITDNSTLNPQLIGYEIKTF